MRCESCGAPALPEWEFCRACGADLPEDQESEEHHPSWRRRIALPGRPRFAVLPLAPLGARLARGAGAARGTLSRLPASRPARGARGLPRALGRIPRTALGVVAAGVIAVLAVLLAVTTAGWLGARAELDQAGREIAEVAQTLDETRATAASERALQSQGQSDAEREAQTARDGAERARQERDQAAESLAEAEGRARGLEDRLTALEGTIGEQQALVAAQTQRLNALDECLVGTQVALEFARAGRENSADRALEAVADACAEARPGG